VELIHYLLLFLFSISNNYNYFFRIKKPALFGAAGTFGVSYGEQRTKKIGAGNRLRKRDRLQMVQADFVSVAGGIRRPGAITRRIEGLSTKVQTDCLKKMTFRHPRARGLRGSSAASRIPLDRNRTKMIEILKTVETLQLEIEARRNR
jgi:hypothetical protein